MYIVVDERPAVRSAYIANFEKEGISSIGLFSQEFHEWLRTASEDDLDAVQGFVLGEFDQRKNAAKDIRRHSIAPIFAVSDQASLDETIDLLTANFDDVFRKTVHVKEILARSQAVWRRATSSPENILGADDERLRVFFDGRDPEFDGEPISLPRRERQILEYMIRNRTRRVSKTQIFGAVYGIFAQNVDESVIEGHISKLRKKLRGLLGRDPIDAKRFLGYQFMGAA
jgi:DNA-binding response OmpR family regulator